MRISTSQWKKISQKTPSKFGNQPVMVDGMRFDSKKEARRYTELKLLEKAGEIICLQRQVPFVLQPKCVRFGKTVHPIKYIADFVYWDLNGNMHVEDTKGIRTDVYKLKKKMMLYQGYQIEET